MSDYISIDLGQDYMAHYGVRGMRWGVRNDDESSTTNSELTEKQKRNQRIAKAGKAAIGVVLLSYGVYQIKEAVDAVVGDRNAAKRAAVIRSQRWRTQQVRDIMNEGRANTSDLRNQYQSQLKAWLDSLE